MTDFFAELEQHLVDAARRERRPRLRPGPIVAAVVIAAVVVAVALGARPAVDEREVGVQPPTPTPTPEAGVQPPTPTPTPERGVQPPTPTPTPERGVQPPTPTPTPKAGVIAPTPTPTPTRCVEPTDDAPPRRWSKTLAVLARPASGAERAFGQRLPAALAQQGAYRDFARLARVVGGREYWLVPVKNVVVGGECPGPRRQTRGVCLYIVDDGAGMLQNCSMPAGIRTLFEWMARPVKGGREIVGVMPNGVVTMRMDDPELGRRTFGVVGNVVVGRVTVRNRFELDNARWSFRDASGREVSPP